MPVLPYFWGNSAFGCEEPFAGITQSSDPFTQISPSWSPSGFVGRPSFSAFEGKNIVVLPIEFTGCYFMFDEPPKEISEWTELAKTHLQKSVEEFLVKKNLKKPKILSIDDLTEHQQSNQLETRLLFDVLHVNLRNPFPRFPEKEVSDYSVGKEIADLFFGAEVFVLIKGHYHVNSPGRDAAALGLATAVSVEPLLSGATIAAVGPSAVGLLFETASVTISFIEASSGNLIWLKHELLANNRF